MENALIVFLYIFNLVLFFIYPYWYVLRKKEYVLNLHLIIVTALIPLTIGLLESKFLSRYIFIGASNSEIRNLIPTLNNPLFVITSIFPARIINYCRFYNELKPKWDKRINQAIDEEIAHEKSDSIDEKLSQTTAKTKTTSQSNPEKLDVSVADISLSNQCTSLPENKSQTKTKDNSTTIVLTIFLIISVFLNIYIYYAFNISTLKYYDESVVFLVDNDPLYHKYKCPYIDTSKEYHLVNKEFALYYDYAPCEECN